MTKYTVDMKERNKLNGIIHAPVFFKIQNSKGIKSKCFSAHYSFITGWNRDLKIQENHQKYHFKNLMGYNNIKKYETYANKITILVISGNPNNIT